MRNNDLKNLADMIIKKLLDKGFVIQRYDAYSTDSIYLKLDYGVCNSIRISNHSGKKYLKYRYNIGSHIEKVYAEKDIYDQYYFPDRQAEQMINQIISDKEDKIKRFGEQRYKSYMSKNQKDKSGKKGFWVKAVLVK